MTELGIAIAGLIAGIITLGWGGNKTVVGVIKPPPIQIKSLLVILGLTGLVMFMVFFTSEIQRWHFIT